MSDDLEQMGKLKEHLDKQFADFVILGLDSNGEFGSCVNVGILNENSMSNRDRINEMVGQIEILKYNLIIDEEKTLLSGHYNEFFQFFKDEALQVFSDYIVIGIDLLGRVNTYYSIIKERKARMIGELEETKLQLQLGSIGLTIDLGDQEDLEEDSGDVF